MAQKITYTQCSDYTSLISDWHTSELRPLVNMAGCAEHS